MNAQRFVLVGVLLTSIKSAQNIPSGTVELLVLNSYLSMALKLVSGQRLSATR